MRDFEYDEKKIEESRNELSKLESDKKRHFVSSNDVILFYIWLDIFKFHQLKKLRNSLMFACIGTSF